MLLDHLNTQLREREAQLQQLRRRIAESGCGPQQRMAAEGERPRDMLGFCGNDYLGMARHPRVVEALAEGARLHGAGGGSSHVLGGYSRAHAELEDTIAACLAPTMPGCRVLHFASGYLANLAMVTALADEHSTIFSDRRNHASLTEAGVLAKARKAKVVRYAHRELEGLARALAESRSSVKLIVTDAVFGMDGELAPLRELLLLAEAHDAWILADDAHGFGVLGPQGRGTLAHLGVAGERLVLAGSLAKAVGVAGAFVAAHPTVIRWLLQGARTYVHSTATPPAIAHAARASLALVMGEEGDRRRSRLRQLGTALDESLSGIVAALPPMGWEAPGSEAAVHPFIVGDNESALALSAALDAVGVWVPAIRPPGVPVGTARLRIALCADHTEGDIWRLCSALADAVETLLP